MLSLLDRRIAKAAAFDAARVHRFKKGSGIPLRDRFVAQRLDVISNTPEEFTAIIARDPALWIKPVKSANIRLQ